MSRCHGLSPECERSAPTAAAELFQRPPNIDAPVPLRLRGYPFLAQTSASTSKAEPSPLSASTLSFSSAANSVAAADCVDGNMSIPQAGTGTGSWLDFINLPSIAFDCYQCESDVVTPAAGRSENVNTDPYVPATRKSPDRYNWTNEDFYTPIKLLQTHVVDIDLDAVKDDTSEYSSSPPFLLVSCRLGPPRPTFISSIIPSIPPLHLPHNQRLVRPFKMSLPRKILLVGAKQPTFMTGAALCL